MATTPITFECATDADEAKLIAGYAPQGVTTIAEFITLLKNNVTGTCAGTNSDVNGTSSEAGYTPPVYL